MSTTRSQRAAAHPRPARSRPPRGTTASPCAAAARSTADRLLRAPRGRDEGGPTPPTASAGMPSSTSGRRPTRLARPPSTAARSVSIRRSPPGPTARPDAAPGGGPAPRRTAGAWGRPCPGCRGCAGSNAHRTSCMVSRSSALNIFGMYLDLSTPTPCSPVIEPPCSRHASRIAPDTSSARSSSPRDLVVEQHQRVQVAVAGVEHVRDPDPGVGRQRGDLAPASRPARYAAPPRPARCSPG